MKFKLFRTLLCTTAFSFSALFSFAQTNALWLRYPSISPDGKTIAFGYKGDIYKISTEGGVATPLIISEYHDQMPIWSHDGKTIAFASNRYGNFDIFTLPATGGAAKRLTFNSANDYPSDFTVDNKSVLFSSGHQSTAESVRFPQRGLFLNLYTVTATGGRPLLVSVAGAENAHYNSKGTKIIFQDRKGYEDAFRKHHVSSVTRDIWELDLKNNTYKKISDFEGEDREPVYSTNDDQIFYLNERDGTQNVYSQPAAGAAKKLTSFKDYPVRNLSIADNNTLCFTYNGEIYVMAANGQPRKVNVEIGNETSAEIEKNIPINTNISEFAASPSGKEIAFVSRGEVFVSSVENGQTKRITNTPQQERSVRWSPDGKSLVYAGERNGSWDVFRVQRTRSSEPYFYASTVLKEEAIIATGAEEFQPDFSPDGKEIAYVENRNILKIYNIASKNTRTVLPEGRNHSYSDGDWGFNWSPDSKWLVVDDQNGYTFASNISLIKADGSGQIIQPINSGFGEGGGKWAMNGKALTWVSSKNGRKSLAQQGSAETDIFISFFDKAAYDNFKLSKDEFNLWKETTDAAKKDTTKTVASKTPVKDTKTPDSIKKVNVLELKDLDNRTIKLTINSSSISDYALNNEGNKLFYLAQFENGYDLWVTEPRTHDTKILAKLGGSPSGLEISKDGKSLFVSNNGRLVKVDAENGKISPININGEITLNTVGERAYIYEHIWRQVKQKFYDPKLHNVNWDAYKAGYAKFLSHISNNFDFQELLSELLGELNASHTGGRYAPRPVAPDQTASIGILADETYANKGVKIAEVLTSGPLDKFESKIKAGYIIEKINGNEIAATDDWTKYLNREVGKTILLSIYDPINKTRFDEAVKTISAGEENELMYKRWVKSMREMVDRLSGGKIGYVHVRGMDDGSYRVVVDEALGINKEKDALIVDTRFNGGGWLHNDLNSFLSGKPYLTFSSQGNALKGQEPFNTWTKPSAVVMSESNYSDAFIFPYIYKQTGTGKLIGMPVPGTGTAVWWETQIDPTIVFGIPMIGTIGKEGRTTENLQVEPDIKVTLPYESFLSGKDTQIEAAVKEMLRVTKK
jgi:tricorn protease